MDAWPIEEVWFRPAVTPLVCAVVPFASARLLGAILSGEAAAMERGSRAVGFAQLQLAWVLGATAGRATGSGRSAWP